MYILGINPSIDAATSLLDEKNIIAAVSEERFERKKHLRAFPLQSLKYCLEAGKIKMSDIKAAAVCWNPGIHLDHLSILRGGNFRHYSELLIHIPYYLLKESNLKPASNSTSSYVKQEFIFKDKKNPLEIYYINHHLSHAASAFFLSPYKNAAILTIDGYGEETSGLMAVAKKNNINPVKELFFPHSIGSIYAAITQYLGFTPNQDEGKVMGLSAWGKPAYYSKLKKIIKVLPGGDIELDLSYFSFYMERHIRVSQKFTDEFGPAKFFNEPITGRHKNLASSLQKIISEVVCQLAYILYEKTGEKNLCLAGGVALNCGINGILRNRLPFKNIFVPPAPGDDGNSLGAALYLKHIILGYPKINYPEKVYLGTDFENKKIKEMLSRCNVDYLECKNPEKKAAELLAQNKIIGWFLDRMEFGPRALGNRSILAHPGGEKVKERLDYKIKKRAEFRPYAPSILKEKYSLFFKENVDSPYMSFCSEVLQEQREKIKQVVHKDGTARVQIVDNKINSKFYLIIKEFEKLSGLPLVLNTSLNTHHQPIVNTPEEALQLFFTTDLDAIFLGKYLIRKN
ncbi:hypothetical protein HY745_05695 [Candidatus Desantisbacteria bacterium]|nr:hypothetical protein [Candidatus Desantisbacteria bacterium]